MIVNPDVVDVYTSLKTKTPKKTQKITIHLKPKEY